LVPGFLAKEYVRIPRVVDRIFISEDITTGPSQFPQTTPSAAERYVQLFCCSLGDTFLSLVYKPCL
jgi:hypothetical protein